MTGVLDPVLPLERSARTMILFKPFSGPEIRSAVGNILAGKEPVRTIRERPVSDVS
jgi:hypothetical protein